MASVCESANLAKNEHTPDTPATEQPSLDLVAQSSRLAVFPPRELPTFLVYGRRYHGQWPFFRSQGWQLEICIHHVLLPGVETVGGNTAML